MPTAEQGHYAKASNILAFKEAAEKAANKTVSKSNAAARPKDHVIPRDRDAKKKPLAEILSFSERMIRGWLSRMRKDAKQARDERIFDMWLACHTQEEIAAKLGCDEKTVGNVVSGISARLPDFQTMAVLTEEERDGAHTHGGRNTVSTLMPSCTTTKRPSDRRP